MARPADPRKSVPGQPRLQRFTPKIAEIPLRPAGLEPATLGLEIPCSIHLSYGRECLIYRVLWLCCLGAISRLQPKLQPPRVSDVP
jgi:hypothetical protein